MDSGLRSNMRFKCSLYILGVFYARPFFCYSHMDPLALGRADPRCWDSSSAILLEMRQPRISDSVSGFWEFMIFLKSSENLKHGALFWDLAQLFWDIYIDCVLSRTHGLGKRQLGQQLSALPSWITRRLFSPIQRTLENKVKKELSEHLLGIQVRNAESALFRKTTGQPGMKKQQD